MDDSVCQTVFLCVCSFSLRGNTEYEYDVRSIHPCISLFPVSLWGANKNIRFTQNIINLRRTFMFWCFHYLTPTKGPCAIRTWLVSQDFFTMISSMAPSEPTMTLHLRQWCPEFTKTDTEHVLVASLVQNKLINWTTEISCVGAETHLKLEVHQPLWTGGGGNPWPRAMTWRDFPGGSYALYLWFSNCGKDTCCLTEKQAKRNLLYVVL